MKQNPAKKKYLEFIGNPKIPPLVKLFGWDAETTPKSSKEVHKQFRTLMPYVHSDKNSNEDDLDVNKQLCVLIGNAKDAYEKNPNVKPSFQEGLIHLQNGKWQLAQLALEDISEFSPIFALKAGDFTAAINCCAENEILADLEQCRLQFAEQNTNVENLIYLVSQIKAIALFLQEKIRQNFELNEFKLIDVVPHTLYLKIARYYQTSFGYTTEYEKFLRLAIRNCLSIEEKQFLIFELENYIRAAGKPIIDIKTCIYKEIKVICDTFKDQCNILISKDRDDLTQLLSVFLEDPYNSNNRASLLLLFKKADQIIKGEYIRSELVYVFYSIFINYDNNRLKEFSAALDLLKGVNFYLNNEFRKTTSYFKQKHEIFYYISIIELNYYQEALTFFADAEQNDFILELSYAVMNRYDCTAESKIPPHLCLREIDDFQMAVIESHYKAQNL